VRAKDWHIDFAASSVYYTIHSGSKVRLPQPDFGIENDLTPEPDLSRRSSSSNRQKQTLPHIRSVSGPSFSVQGLQETQTLVLAGSGDADHQQNVWLGDWCDEVRKVTLYQGDTMRVCSVA
jgi:F-box/leucine-rich repeat protein 10/11